MPTLSCGLLMAVYIYLPSHSIFIHHRSPQILFLISTPSPRRSSENLDIASPPFFFFFYLILEQHRIFIFNQETLEEIGLIYLIYIYKVLFRGRGCVLCISNQCKPDRAGCGSQHGVGFIKTPVRFCLCKAGFVLCNRSF